jgi:hypothetical protein
MATDPNESVAGAIRAEMARQRISTRNLAELMDHGHSYTWIQRRTSGTVPLTVGDVHEFARALGVDPDLLLRPAVA